MKHALKSIISTRAFQNWPSFHLIYEYEDIIAATMGLKIETPGSIYYWRIRRPLNRLLKLLRPNAVPKRLIFIMSASADFSGDFGPEDIPVFVDYFIPRERTASFLKSISANRLALITSRQVYDHLIASGGDPRRIHHWPLSLSDKYALTPSTTYNKKWDLVIIGRTSPRFTEYLDRYIKDHSLKMLSRRIEDGHFNLYDPEGKLVGNADTREGYLSLLSRSRVVLYTTPGTDSDRETNGFNQVTPRFLEALAMGCNPVMRYIENSDTRYFRLPDFGASVETYSDFEKAMDAALSAAPDLAQRAAFLKEHYTTTRCQQLIDILNE